MILHILGAAHAAHHATGLSHHHTGAKPSTHPTGAKAVSAPAGKTHAFGKLGQHVSNLFKRKA